MMSLFSMDLEQPLSDPFSRGMLPESTFRVSGFDSSVTTGTIVRCLSNLQDSNNNRVNFEIVWVDDTTFLVSASHSSAQVGANEDEDDVITMLSEHGELILDALQGRFDTKETIVRFDEYLRALEGAAEPTATGDDTWTARFASFVQRTLFSTDSTDNGNKRRMVEDVDRVEASAKRRRIV